MAAILRASSNFLIAFCWLFSSFSVAVFIAACASLFAFCSRKASFSSMSWNRRTLFLAFWVSSAARSASSFSSKASPVALTKFSAVGSGGGGVYSNWAWFTASAIARARRMSSRLYAAATSTGLACLAFVRNSVSAFFSASSFSCARFRAWPACAIRLTIYCTFAPSIASLSISTVMETSSVIPNCLFIHAWVKTL